MKREWFLGGLIGLNVVIFLAQLSGWDWRDVGALYTPQSGLLHGWQWLTHMFLHEDVLHLLMNMYAIYFFGSPVLATMRVWQFGLLLLVGGLVGGAAYELTLYWQIERDIGQMAAQSGLADAEIRSAIVSGSLNAPRAFLQMVYSQMLGASGMAFAILGAFAVRFPNAPLGIMFLPFSFKAQYFVLTLVIYEIFAQFSGISLFGDNIAHMAHVGGAVAGAFLAWLWRKRHIRLVK